MIDANNPSYYRAHQYKNQFDLPNSAFKNRDLQSNPSSIPQGKDYFEQSNKKHFSYKFNRSEIQEDNVLHQYPQQQVRNSRIAFEPSYFRSLNVNDIEGTQPNTLISKALKNRQRAAELMKKQEKSSQKQYKPMTGTQNYLIQPHQFQSQFINEPYLQNKLFINKQIEAVNKFKKSKSIMQNNSSNVLNNFSSRNNSYQPVNLLTNSSKQYEEKNQSDNYSNNFHYRGLQKKLNNDFAHFDTLQSDDEQVMEKEIKKPMLKQQRAYEIENQLVSKLDFKPNNYQSQGIIKKNKTERDNHNLRQVNTKFQQQENNNHLIDQKNYQPSNQDYFQNHKNEIYNQGDYLSNHKQNLNQNKNGYQINNQIQNPISKNFTPQIDKSNIRKFNPTFLSFQSQTLPRHQK